MTILNKVAASLILVAGVLGLASCSGVTGLDALVRNINTHNATVEKMDVAAPEDLSSGSLSVTQAAINGRVILSSRRIQEAELTIGEKIDLILSLRDSIKTKQTTIDAAKIVDKEIFATLKSNVAAFKALNVPLTDEEKALVTAERTEIRTLRDDAEATLGLVYRRLADLRNKYQVENLDVIITTYQTADDAMTVRVHVVTRVGEIITEVNQLLVDRLA